MCSTKQEYKAIKGQTPVPENRGLNQKEKAKGLSWVKKHSQHELVSVPGIKHDQLRTEKVRLLEEVWAAIVQCQLHCWN